MKTIIVAFTIGSQVPLAAAYLTASAGQPVEILEQTIEYQKLDNTIVKSVAEKLLLAKPDVLCFSCYVWNLQYCALTASLAKSLMPKLKIVCGGPAVSFTDDFLDQNLSVDIVVDGEGEISFANLLACLECKGRIAEVNGISYRDGTIRHNAPQELIKSLDSIPSPYLTGKITPRNELWIETHRGCFFKCAYCIEFKNYHTIRPFSVERIESELKWAIANGARRINFCNSIFNITPERTHELCTMLAKYSKHGLELVVDSYAEFFTGQMLDDYKDAGIFGTEIGLQSTNPTALKNMNRPPIDKERFRNSVNGLKSRSIKVSIHVILGLPGDNLESFKRTMAFVSELEPDELSIFKLLVLPGTAVAKRADELGIVSNPSPPFEVWQTASWPAEELLAAEAYAKSYYKEYAARCPR